MISHTPWLRFFPFALRGSGKGVSLSLSVLNSHLIRQRKWWKNELALHWSNFAHLRMKKTRLFISKVWCERTLWAYSLIKLFMCHICPFRPFRHSSQPLFFATTSKCLALLCISPCWLCLSLCLTFRLSYTSFHLKSWIWNMQNVVNRKKALL